MNSRGMGRLALIYSVKNKTSYNITRKSGNCRVLLSMKGHDKLDIQEKCIYLFIYGSEGTIQLS
jgi:hypothetical protein